MIILLEELAGHACASSPLVPPSRQTNDPSSRPDQVKRYLACIRLWHRKVQNQNFSRLGFEPKTCPVKERTANQISQAEMLQVCSNMLCLGLAKDNSILVSLACPSSALVVQEGFVYLFSILTARVVQIGLTATREQH